MGRIAFVLWFAMGASLLSAAEQPSGAELAEYEARLAAEREAGRKYQEATLLWISALPQRDGLYQRDYFQIHYRVTKTGYEEDWRDAGLAIQANHSKQLSEAELAKLKQAILALPAKSVQPPGNRLVSVHFWEGANWVRRTYDSESLPEAVRQMYDVIGERFETREVGVPELIVPK